MNNYLVITLIIWNFAVFLIYGLDKFKAVHKKRRISEKCLILISFLFGFIGSTYGMIVFNHKTSKTKFRILVPLFALIDIALALIALKLFN